MFKLYQIGCLVSTRCTFYFLLYKMTNTVRIFFYAFSLFLLGDDFFCPVQLSIESLYMEDNSSSHNNLQIYYPDINK